MDFSKRGSGGGGFQAGHGLPRSISSSSSDFGDLGDESINGGFESDSSVDEKFFMFPNPNDQNVTQPYGSFVPRSADGHIMEMDFEDPDANAFWRFMMFCCPCFIGNPCSVDKREEYQRAIKTFILTMTCVQIIMFIVCCGFGIAPWAENWGVGPSEETLIMLGAGEADLMYRWRIWRFVTPIFLTANVVQLLYNTFVQIRMGLYLERTWGWTRLGGIYFVSGMGGILLDALTQPNGITVASSAAMLGMMAAYLVEVLCTLSIREHTQRNFALLQCALYPCCGIFIIFLPFNQTSCLFGGYVTGLVMGSILFIRETNNPITTKWVPRILITILSLYFLLGYVMFYAVVYPLNKPSEDTSGSTTGTADPATMVAATTAAARMVVRALTT